MICDWSSDTFNHWQLIVRFISEDHLFGGVSMRHLTRFVPPPLAQPKMSFTNHNCHLMMTDVMSDKRLIQQMIGKRVAWHPSLVLSAVAQNP